MFDYLPSLDALPEDISNISAKDSLRARIKVDARGKRALRRQRARNKKKQEKHSDCFLAAVTNLRGQRKISHGHVCHNTEKKIDSCDRAFFGQVDTGLSQKSTIKQKFRAVTKKLDYINQNKKTSREYLSSKPIWVNQHFVSPETEIYAALDLGTNNCRLLIATPTGSGRFRTLDRFSRIIRLGEGVSTCHVLSDAAVERAIEALDICRAKLSQWPICHQRLIATEACRLAANGHEFLQRVRNQLGLELEIISRETETRLAVAGCSPLVDHNTEALVLFDIGGGSSEIALIDISKRRSRTLAEHIIAWASLPVGVVTLAERFGGVDVGVDDFACMKAYVKSLIDQFDGRDKLGDLIYSPSFYLLGTSGTMTTLASIHLGLKRYDRRQIDGVWMRGEDVTHMTQRLLSWNIDERMSNPCIGAERADLVLAGCAILEAIRAYWPSKRLRVADRGLREGILMELMP